jgi:hypothetical protein
MLRYDALPLEVPLRSSLPSLLAMISVSTMLVLATGCGGSKDDDDDDDTGTDGDDGGDDGDDGGDDGDDGGGGGCPDSVPEQYRYIWDCDAETCDGSMLYRYGVGASDADGDMVITEQWFMFNGPGDFCVDTFELEGETSPIDPTTFNCSQCEETYEVEWNHTGTECGVIWGGIFFGQDGQGEEAPYEGFMMYDTHTAFGDRNPDNAMLVIAAPVLGSTYYPQSNYARGTATPSTSEDAPPEDYVYVNAGSCLGGLTAGGGPTVVVPGDTLPGRIATPIQP